MLYSVSALASREGAAVADGIVAILRWVVPIVLATFVACTAGGAVHGARKANHDGESVLKGSARGLLRGLLAFAIVVAAALVVLAALGFLWIAFSFLYVYVINPDVAK
jgi:uncharacterized RDD family membrane protein YckC